MADWQNRIVGYGEEKPDQLLANPANFRVHPKRQQDALKGSLDTLGYIQTVLVNRTTGHIVDGHLRVIMALREEQKTIPVTYVELSEAEEAQALLSLDPIAALAGSDSQKVGELLARVQTDNQNVMQFLTDLAKDNGIDAVQPDPHKTLAERFIVPPFSVLDARQGYWQARKAAWIALGIQSELGRGENLQGLSESNDTDRYSKNEFLARIGRGPLATAEVFGSGKPGDLHAEYSQKRGNLWHDGGEESTQKVAAAGRRLQGSDGEEHQGTSIFDPVLCEIAYRWFIPQGKGRVLDPFAGGSVRGVVASILGKDYVGIDLSERQIEANRAQAAQLCKDQTPVWVVGDSLNAKELAAGEYDMIFSCPPYGDLEIYSDDPADLSNMEFGDFVSAYMRIIEACVSMLRDNRFACFVVGDFRDKRGFYRNFPALTIDAFQSAGMTLYNEAILVTAVGSLPIRVGKQFEGYRKLGKTHQNVLVFYKGDPKAVSEFGPVECGELVNQEAV